MRCPLSALSSPWTLVPGVALLSLGTGCTSLGEPLDVTLAGDAGLVTFAIRSDGPITEGRNDFELTFAEPNASFVSALASMPSMGHLAEPEDVMLHDDRVHLVGVPLVMSGEWALAVSAHAPAGTDSATVFFEVP
jgi:hypothetical protein